MKDEIPMVSPKTGMHICSIPCESTEYANKLASTLEEEGLCVKAEVVKNTENLYSLTQDGKNF
jgi:predicted transcriptional regulator